MSELRDLVRALGAASAGLTDWVARASATRTVWRARDGHGDRSGERTERAFTADVHRDVPSGRGSASFVVGPDAPFAVVVADAASRAQASVGAPWRSPPPAAAARVLIADPDVHARELAALPGALVDELIAAARSSGTELRGFDVQAELTEVRIATSRGLDAGWRATRFVVDAVVEHRGARATVHREVRRRPDLGLRDAVLDALIRASRRANARPLPRGSYPVIARAHAFLHGGRGLLAALVGQADPALERQGLVRYRPGQPIAPGAGTLPHPLTVSSDGTMPFGLRSAPLGDHGEPVRRFELIARGIARGLSLDPREAFTRGAQPNGGVRGLVIAAGDLATDDLVRALSPALLVEELSWLDVAPVTGQFRGAIALATLVDGERRTDVTGGVLRGDAIGALALGRRSLETAATAEYRGPAAWALGALAVD